jgi:hypothetical protein
MRVQCTAPVWERSTRATATITRPPPTSMDVVTDSPSRVVPSRTAMIGFTYA